jgi:Cu2+-exporting ATPase
VQVVAAGRLFRGGAYLKSGDALERIAACDHIIFDKTGTLTLGAPKLSSTDIDAGVFADAASLARASRHPLSRGLTTAAGPGPVATMVKEFPGLGLEGIVNGTVCRLGSAQWVRAAAPAASAATLYFMRGDEEPVAFRFEDELQSGAQRSITSLKRLGFGLEIVSGDRADAVKGVGLALGIDTWTAAASPQDKVRRLEALQADGKRVLMIGDGLNDAPALATGHASLSPANAADISQTAADAVFQGERLAPIIETLMVAKAARRLALQNFAIAIGYNIVFVPLAMAGYATPLMAAIAMSTSSLAVTANALRLGRNSLWNEVKP